MRTVNIIKGLQILEAYHNNPGGYNVGAEHDVIYGFGTDRPLSDEDLQAMIELGWFQDHDECDEEEEFSPSEYRQDESWVCRI